MIANRAMRAAVHISVWAATKHDRKESRAVADQNGARERAGRCNKQLWMGAEKLEELRTLAGQIQQYFYDITPRDPMKVCGCCLPTSSSTSRQKCASSMTALSTE
jgi:hypothetical protein